MGNEREGGGREGGGIYSLDKSRMCYKLLIRYYINYSPPPVVQIAKPIV